MNANDYINLITALDRGHPTVIADAPRFLHPLPPDAKTDRPRGWKRHVNYLSDAMQIIHRLSGYEHGKTYAEVCYRTALEMLEESWARIPRQRRSNIDLPVSPVHWPGSWSWSFCSANAANFRRICTIFKKQIPNACENLHLSSYPTAYCYEVWDGWKWWRLFNDIRRVLTECPDKDWYPDWWLRCRSRLAVKLGSKNKKPLDRSP